MIESASVVVLFTPPLTVLRRLDKPEKMRTYDTRLAELNYVRSSTEELILTYGVSTRVF